MVILNAQGLVVWASGLTAGIVFCHTESVSSLWKISLWITILHHSLRWQITDQVFSLWYRMGRNHQNVLTILKKAQHLLSSLYIDIKTNSNNKGILSLCTSALPVCVELIVPRENIWVYLDYQHVFYFRWNVPVKYFLSAYNCWVLEEMYRK